MVTGAQDAVTAVIVGGGGGGGVGLFPPPPQAFTKSIATISKITIGTDREVKSAIFRLAPIELRRHEIPPPLSHPRHVIVLASMHPPLSRLRRSVPLQLRQQINATFSATFSHRRPNAVGEESDEPVVFG
jgi:hypothetical protein